MNRKIILTASLFGISAVIFGAFGAHTIKDAVSPSGLDIWNKGVSYQFYHVFALLFLSTFARFKNRLVNLSYIFFTIGIIFFSGSLYLLATREITGWSFVHFMGPITPLGGLCFILGWAMLFLAAMRHK
ncbi:DUF423 domain-containing protein [Pedobacter duraquae]|uniref:Uncharacterized membrane protein YgdD (TMEM256/DUF423 family) n=1 Tax=Pedobacter duraquae TaxID=425511 RepID=A0A4R6IQ13_9SPHI|nr:DUF423 domain-containing protein [Pedobacter duraquae]TDO24402.1 uncharacterized membrane protein YgdD (TMEM256/DUF423 family) [Pedobacter duraquae]